MGKRYSTEASSQKKKQNVKSKEQMSRGNTDEKSALLVNEIKAGD